MQRFLATVAALACVVSPLAVQGIPPVTPPIPGAPASEPAKPVDMDAVSFIIGTDLGQKLKNSRVEANLDQILAGIKAGLAGGEPKFTQDEQREIMTAFQNELRARHMKRQAELGEKNTKIAEEFLAENAKKEGVVTTDSGLQYMVLKEGDGPKPKPTDKVKAVYKGELIDGTVFDDSRGQPREFSVSGGIKGWQEALPMMATGSKWRLFVPPALAYGPTQRGQHIEPNSLLVFDIELVGISKPAIAVTPPVRVPLNPADTKKKERITAVTPPVSVPIPPKKEAAPKDKE